MTCFPWESLQNIWRKEPPYLKLTFTKRTQSNVIHLNYFPETCTVKWVQNPFAWLRRLCHRQAPWGAERPRTHHFSSWSWQLTKDRTAGGTAAAKRCFQGLCPASGGPEPLHPEHASSTRVPGCRSQPISDGTHIGDTITVTSWNSSHKRRCILFRKIFWGFCVCVCLSSCVCVCVCVSENWIFSYNTFLNVSCGPNVEKQYF